LFRFVKKPERILCSRATKLPIYKTTYISIITQGSEPILCPPNIPATARQLNEVLMEMIAESKKRGSGMKEWGWE
jgi:hypothetical protein